jgi:hypothetical protein
MLAALTGEDIAHVRLDQGLLVGVEAHAVRAGDHAVLAADALVPVDEHETVRSL